MTYASTVLPFGVGAPGFFVVVTSVTLVFAGAPLLPYEIVPVYAAHGGSVSTPPNGSIACVDFLLHLSGSAMRAAVCCIGTAPDGTGTVPPQAESAPSAASPATEDSKRKGGRIDDA